jgi:hypothetical protein
MNKEESKQVYADLGYVTFAKDSHELEFIDWDLLTRLIPLDYGQYEYIESGDTDESTSVYVYRVLLEGNPPTLMNADVSSKILKIVGSERALKFFEELTGNKDLFIRRSQIHILPKEGHVGYHIDSHSSPHYKTAVVFQIKHADAGGEFMVYPDNKPATSVGHFDVLVTDAELPHEVKKVIAGNRISLVFWLADSKEND